jgi:hypothetical protein
MGLVAMYSERLNNGAGSNVFWGLNNVAGSSIFLEAKDELVIISAGRLNIQ